MSVRHFLTLLDLSTTEIKQLLARASELKKLQQQHQCPELFPNYVLGMLFEKASTRTRISFEAGMAQFGGHAMFLSPRDTQLGRGEPIKDSAKVMSSMVDIIMIRTFEHERIEQFAAHSSVPVINALTDDFHPCQLLADLQTWQEHRGDIQGKTVSWIGDGNNMCQSYILAAAQMDFELKIACPTGYEPRADLLEKYSKHVRLVASVDEAASGSDLLVTDVWASMGQEEQQAKRVQAFEGFQVNHELLGKANSGALFMHCLPAHRGEEVSAELMDDPSIVVWDEAENRLHAQKALIEFLVNQ